MRANKMWFVVLGTGLSGPFPALAQQGGMVVPPPAIQAIDTHLQQTRTREQREMIESKSVALVQSRQTTSPTGSKRNPVAAKPKEVPSTIRDLDEQAIFDRPGSIGADGKSQRRFIK